MIQLRPWVSSSIKAAYLYGYWMAGAEDIYRVGNNKLFISKVMQPEYMQCQVIFQTTEIA